MKIRHLGVLVLVFALVGSLALAQGQKYKYRFVMVSHIGTSDPNHLWLQAGLKVFEQKYPDVKVQYVTVGGTWTLPKFVQLLQQTIATKPDGIAVPILNADAEAPVLDAAIKSGIPVVAFNVPDSRPVGTRIPYLTYVGGDLYQDGVKSADLALAAAKAGKIPEPKAAVCANPATGNSALNARCNGFLAVMKKNSIPASMLYITQDPAKAANVTEAYLSGHKDVNLVYDVTTYSEPWVYGVAKKMGLDPAVDDQGMTVLGVDASPLSITGVENGNLLSSNSQGFWLQGYLPMVFLYWYKDLGLAPQSNVMTGPVMITKSNAKSFETLVRNVFGTADYNKEASGW